MKKSQLLATGLGLTLPLLAIGAASVSDTRAPGPKPVSETVAAHRAKAVKFNRQASPLRISGGSAGDAQLYGLCVTLDYDETLDYGIVSIGTGRSNDPSKLLATFADTPNPWGGCYIGNGKYLMISMDDDPDVGDLVQYSLVNTDTWEIERNYSITTNNEYLLPTDLAYDPVSKLCYGEFLKNTKTYATFEDTTPKLYSFDPSKWTFNDIVEGNKAYVGDLKCGNTPVRLRSIVCDKQGQLYGIGRDANYYKVNKVTAECTLVGKLSYYAADPDANPVPDGFSFNWAKQSAVMDWETGAIYHSYADDYFDTYLAKIDPATLKMTIVGDYSYSDTGTGECVGFSGLFFKQEAGALGIPAAPTGLSAKAVGTDLKAEVSFVLPTANTEGESLSGNVDWTISDGADAVATGSGAPGSEVSKTVDVAGGMTTISVKASDGGAESAPVSVQLFVGCDVPVIARLPEAEADGCRVTVTWEAAKAQNGGNMVPVTYKVVRQPGAVTVTESTADTEAVDNVTEPVKSEYTYEVTPMAGTVAGATVISRPVVAGNCLALPHLQSFDNETTFAVYPILDANEDNNTWFLDKSNGSAVYSSNSNNADDYLLIGPFDMKAGWGYRFAMNATNSGPYETVAVYIAENTESAAGYTELIAPTGVNYLGLSVDRVYTCPVDGLRYFAIKACSGANAGMLNITDVSVKAVSGDCPASVTGLTFIPQPKGAKFSFTLPEKNYSGTAAAGVSAYRVVRDGVLIAEETAGVSDGAVIEFTDPTDIVDFHTYEFFAVNANGESLPTVTEAYLGLDFPGKPRNVRVFEDVETPGLVNVTWDAPAAGFNGGYINPDELTYSIDWMSFSGEMGLSEGIKGLKGQITMSDPEIDGLVACSVYASNSLGTKGREAWETATGYYGMIYQLPMFESFPNATQKSGSWTGGKIDTETSSFSSIWSETSGTITQDGDNGCMLFSGYEDRVAHRTSTPRFSVKGVANPVLVFHYYLTDALERLCIELSVDGSPFSDKVLLEIKPQPKDLRKWVRVELPLDGYADSKWLQVGFAGYAVKASDLIAAIDNVQISDKVDSDLKAQSLTVQSNATVGDRLSLTVAYRNAGSKDLAYGDYTLRLLKNGNPVKEMKGEEVEAYTNAEETFDDVALVTDAASTVYAVELVLDSDSYPADNRVEAKAVTIAQTGMPGVTGLAATSAAGVSLTWTAPTPEQLPADPITESWEDYDDCSIEGFGDWTLYDGDGLNTVITATWMGQLDYPHVGEPMAWQIMDPGANSFWTWYARTGSQVLVAFQATTGPESNQKSDDWLISPELTGGAQTIRFFARAGQGNRAPELMDVMYSTTDNQPSSFTALATDVNVESPKSGGPEWYQFDYTLPAGARYFAIVHKSQGKYALLIDDVTFAPKGREHVKADLLGFNIYRDNALINATPVEKAAFDDLDVEDNREYTYNVTALWTLGESPLSEPVKVLAKSGLDRVFGGNVITVTTLPSTIRVSGADRQQIQVYTTSGVCVGSAHGVAGYVDISVPSGSIYLVKVGNRVTKVAVR